MHDLKLNTVCEEARCPNIGECGNGTATFIILGDVCTRACGYCAVPHGKPAELDLAEPARIAAAIDTLALQYVVITSVDRDDFEDGGCWNLRRDDRRVRASGRCRIEVAHPRLPGTRGAAPTVLDAGPDVLNHNTETVPRLYRSRVPAAGNTNAGAPRAGPHLRANDSGTKTGSDGRSRRGAGRARRDAPRSARRRRVDPDDRSVSAPDRVAPHDGRATTRQTNSPN